MTTDTTTDSKPTHQTLSEVRKSLRVRWYRSPIDNKKLRALSMRTDRQGWKQAGTHASLYVLLVVLCFALWTEQLWLVFWPCLWCLGFVATFFKGTSVHELGHGTVFKTKSLNAVFLYAFSLISWWDHHDYAASHTYHHRYTTHAEADRENVLPLTPSLHPWLLLQLFTLNLFTRPARNFGKGGFLWTVYLTARTALGQHSRHLDIPSQEWIKTLHDDQPKVHQQSVRWSRLLIAFHTGVAIVAVFTGWWVLPLVLSLPSYIANIGSYLLGTTQHCGLIQNSNDFRKNTRSIEINPFLGFLYWHMNWHTEHHMYAGVPCYNLRELAMEVESDMPERKSLFGAWKEMRQIWQHQQQDANYQFEVSVPSGLITQTEGNSENELVNSIGDLAPEHSSLR